MHHALLIHEILSNIFMQCCTVSDVWRPGSELAALARTCCAFKEPALDLLWEELNSLDPLARCLPHACHKDFGHGIIPHYSFHRSLTHAEWDILQSYTRRVRRLHAPFELRKPKLSQKSLLSLSKAPTAVSLFPNLHSLNFDCSDHLEPPLSLPFPSLISLDIRLRDLPPFETFFELLSKTSSGLRRLAIYVMGCTRGMERIDIKFDPKFICRWQYLQAVICPAITLDVTALVHLSRIPTLTSLNFTVGSTSIEHPLVFSNLHRLQLFSPSIELILPLLSQTRYPAITEFRCGVKSFRSKGELSALFSGVQTFGIGHALQDLYCWGGYKPANILEGRPILAEDLQPCMSFRHLRCIEFNIEQNVNLTDSGLLMLASAWPHMERLRINRGWGWHTQSGITPSGLYRLLQMCPSLREIALVIDTQGFTDVDELEGLGPPLPRLEVVDVIDSFIEELSVPAITAFFSRIVSFTHQITLQVNDWWYDPPAYHVHWYDVCQGVKIAVAQDC